MQPVAYQGQTYYASQYFHSQYLADSHQAGKYQRHKDFLRVLRTIPLYPEYIRLGHVQEVAWTRIKSEAAQDLRQWQPLFQAIGYQPLTLINAIAQAEFSHHLEDMGSKQIAHASNTTSARQMTQRVPGASLPEEIAIRKLEAYLHLGRLLRTPEHIVQQEAVKQIEASVGLNLRPLLLAAPAQSHIPPDDKMYEPTDLARELGLASAYAVNRILEQMGWQIKKIGGGWEPTPEGMLYAAEHAWVAEHGTKSGYNLKWNLTAVHNALIAHQALTQPHNPKGGTP